MSDKQLRPSEYKKPAASVDNDFGSFAELRAKRERAAEKQLRESKRPPPKEKGEESA